MAADRSEAEADLQRRDARKFWIGVAILVAVGILFVWWSIFYPMMQE